MLLNQKLQLLRYFLFNPSVASQLERVEKHSTSLYPAKKYYSAESFNNQCLNVNGSRPNTFIKKIQVNGQENPYLKPVQPQVVEYLDL